jgi:sigma-B regulation protein RsbU (phosphoserine phosphatase)
LVMASFRALLRTHAHSGLNPAWIAEIINHKLHEFSGPDDFVSCFYGLFDPGNGELIYANCGHNPPLYLSHQSTLQTLELSGPALGMFEGAHYETSHLCLEPGDLLLLYTDGLVEARNNDGEFFDVDRLEKLFKQNSDQPVDELIQTIVQAARQFIGYEVFLDDVALVVLRRKPG